MISAMTTVILILVLSTILAAWTLSSVRHDDRGHRAPPASHLQDPRFVAPARRL
ncbi:hypothetical protein BH11ACT8_BH11ACT8_24100 [soil metagenome]